MKSKAQVSLEYILIFAAIISVLSFILYETINLYNKNLNIIDNKELKRTSEKLQNIINLFELEPQAKTVIEVNPETLWKIKYKNINSIIIYNKNKDYKIVSNLNIKINKREVCEKSKIIIKKKDNQIYINFEKI